MDGRKLLVCSRSRASSLLANFDPARVITLCTDDGHRARAALGQSFDAVCLDFREGLDAELLGVASGLVWGGGALLICVDDEVPRDRRLVVAPYALCDVGRRFHARFYAALERYKSDPQDLAPPQDPERRARGTREQADVVDQLVDRARNVGHSVLIADRGRGKSAALGLVARHFDDVVVSGPNEAALREVSARAPHVKFVPAFDLAYGPACASPLLLIDEAAQLPVPILNEIAARSDARHVVYASTARGYEGTGRGFLLRFADALDDAARFTLNEAIRFHANDDVEAFTHEVLGTHLPSPRATSGAPVYRVLDRSRDGALLEQAFALLVHAHYRTTPSDLVRMLDAPNLEVHVLEDEGHVQAAALFAKEGELDDNAARGLARGERLRGHALVESLVIHGGQMDAARLSMSRSVRTAVHPARRRSGLGAALVQAHFERADVDLVGTLFGATAALVRFRQSSGFLVCRVGSARGSRTGEPSVRMARAKSAAGAAAIEAMRARLARSLALQLHFLDVEGELKIDPALRKRLALDLEARPLTEDDVARAVMAYARGSAPYEAACVELEAFLAGRALPDILRWRTLERRAWVDTMQRAQLGSVKATMRAVRRAVRALVDLEGDELVAR